MTDITYPTELTNGLSRDDIIVRLKERLDDARFEHCLRVEKTSRKLATRFDEDIDRAGLAGLLHDYAKQIPVTEYRQVIQNEGFDQALLAYGRGIWHGMVGVWFIEHEVGITDPLVLQAIERHTTGAPTMTPLDEITFVADFIEPARKLDGEVAARKAAETSLSDATLIELQNTLTYLVSTNKVVYPQTLLTYNALIRQTN